MTEITMSMSFTELCDSQNIPHKTLQEVIEYGIAQPINDQHAEELTFDTHTVYWIKKAVSLNQQFEIDWVATALAIKLMKQNEQLQKENRSLKRMLQRHVDFR